jgi:N-carbamoyl-L-amino-acid hydrolase
MNPALIASLEFACSALGVEGARLPCGAGHDAGDFASAGIPTGMIFVRNDRGSHNPEESMAIEDFVEGTRVLAWQLMQ